MDVLESKENVRDLLVVIDPFVDKEGVEGFLNLTADLRGQIAFGDHQWLVLLIRMENGSETFDGQGHGGGRENVCRGRVRIGGDVDFLNL